MSESERPAPEYGQYASEEERAEAIARFGGSTTEPGATSGPPTVGVTPGLPMPPTRVDTVPASRSNLVDRMITVFLLAFGAVSVVGSAANFLSLGTTLPEMVKELGMGEFHSSAQTAGLGIVMFVSQVLLWVVAAVWSYRRITRQKLSWWVPVLFGALSFILLSILLGSALTSDPNFVPTLSKL